MAWFENWFDSSYYHILYKNRDEDEANQFIDRILDKLQPASGAKMYDMACGKGRHANWLAKAGNEVVGSDLSPESIAEAKTLESDKLSFYVHDMRKLFRTNYFDYIFNFFTSFGYFKTDWEHEKTLSNVARGLKQGGVFMMDFFNREKVVNNLVKAETKEINGIKFDITRKFENGVIVKTIRFKDNGRDYEFFERVRAFSKRELEQMLNRSGLQVSQIYGDYQLNQFNESSSDRLILFAKKN